MEAEAKALAESGALADPVEDALDEIEQDDEIEAVVEAAAAQAEELVAPTAETDADVASDEPAAPAATGGETRQAPGDTSA